jgi:hypothetical protein
VNYRSAGADVGGAVEQDFVLAAAAAVDGEARGAADVERTQVAPAAGLEDAGRGPGDLEGVAALCGEVGDEFVGEGGVAVGGFGLELGERGVDVDGFGDGADLELDVEAGFFERLEDDVGADDAAEAVLFDSDVLGGGFEKRCGVEAGFVGLRDDGGVLGEVRDGDFGAGDGSAGGVRDGAGEAGADFLRGGGRGGEQAGESGEV